jgi:hypothetical protein
MASSWSCVTTTNVVPSWYCRFELELRVLAQLVERGQRLVEQQQLGTLDERAGKRDALLLSARQLVGVARRERAELHEREHLGHALLDLLRR